MESVKNLDFSAAHNLMATRELLSGEFTATGIRKILQQIFPHRRLVLSQFTFFNQIGVARPTGETFRRRRRCYRLFDVLSIACVLALKEEGIPLKNIATVPKLIQEHASRIFATGPGARISGFGDAVELRFPNEAIAYGSVPIEELLAENASMMTFWGYDVGALAVRVKAAAELLSVDELLRAA